MLSLQRSETGIMIHSEIYIYKSTSVILLNVLFDVPAGDVFRYNEQNISSLLSLESLYLCLCSFYKKCWT